MGNIHSLADIIRVRGVDRADHPALIQDERTLSWADLAGNPSGKVLKKDLREPYWEGHDRRVG